MGVGGFARLWSDVDLFSASLDVAAQAFSEDLAISTRLAALDPANIGWLRDLAAAYSKLGDVRMAQGQLDAAAQAFRAANKTP